MITRIEIECENWNQEDIVHEISRVSKALREEFNVERYSVEDIFPRDNEVVRDEIKGKQPGYYQGRRILLNTSRTSWREERPEETGEPASDNHERT